MEEELTIEQIKDVRDFDIYPDYEVRFAWGGGYKKITYQRETKIAFTSIRISKPDMAGILKDAMNRGYKIQFWYGSLKGINEWPYPGDARFAPSACLNFRVWRGNVT
jgi:hypothetical protein